MFKTSGWQDAQLIHVAGQTGVLCNLGNIEAAAVNAFCPSCDQLRRWVAFADAQVMFKRAAKSTRVNASPWIDQLDEACAFTFWAFNGVIVEGQMPTSDIDERMSCFDDATCLCQIAIANPVTFNGAHACALLSGIHPSTKKPLAVSDGVMRSSP